MRIVRTRTEDSVDLPPGMPQIPGVIFICTGKHPGETGIYGPQWRDTYTEGSTMVDLEDYEYPGDIYVPELEIIPLCDFLLRRASGLMYFGDPGSWGGATMKIRGRQKDGLICPTQYHKARDGLQRDMERNLGLEVLRPEELWEPLQGVPPDLLVRKAGYRFI